MMRPYPFLSREPCHSQQPSDLRTLDQKRVGFQVSVVIRPVYIASRTEGLYLAPDGRS